ncbi:MAG TPA: hypothetical protein VK211_09625, partial [Kamptonema sp.]|nr:hypothetical protein [Kamptonema sp.]
MISEILWKSLVVMPATMAIALSMSTTAIAESIPANIETASNPVSPLSSEDLQPSIEALSNPVTSAIAESIPANIETASNPVLPLSSEDLQPSIEAQSNPATSAIAEPIPANIETASKPVSPLLSAEDVEPTVKALSNPILATESKAKIATSGTASGQELQALPNPSTTSTTAFTTLNPIIADSTDGKAQNHPIEGITSISEPSNLEE